MAAEALSHRSAVVFDMDGVLVDPTLSYRQTVIETVAEFSGRRITFADIEDYKNQGGWNNDWLLSQRILRDQGVEIEFDRIVARFNEIFLGGDHDGLILREEWLVGEGLFARLAQNHRLAVFTGRRRSDAMITLNRFAPGTEFSPVICMEDVVDSKPAPEGLIKIGEFMPRTKLYFIGDTVDDARSARLAGVTFFGVAARNHPRRAELIGALNREGCVAILETVNEIEQAIADCANTEGM